MRTVICPGIGRDVSALGFCCVALGSRISEAQGRRALERAFEHGVTWYDVAPAYGGGVAESILGEFLLGRRDRVAICTRFGGPRAGVSRFAAMFGAAVRVLGKVFPQCHGGLAASLSNGREPLRAEMIEASVVESLRRLRTDYVDVLGLEEASPEECADETILCALRRVVEKGYVRAISIAGTPEAIVAAAGSPARFPFAHFVDNPFEPAAEKLRAELGGANAPFFVTRGIFGRSAFERMSRALVMDGGRLASLASQLGYGPPFLASELMLDYAFGENPEGVVVATMFNQAHIDLNCARASLAPRGDVGPFVKKYVIDAHP